MTHRAHDYRHLVQRWRAVARGAGLRLRTFAKAGALPLFHLRTRPLARGEGIYLSAGIHGDEAGATEGLLEWAEQNGEKFRDLPMLIFPCLNPWGLINNVRHDAEGRDLNRSFHLAEVPVIRAWREIVAPFRFEAALMLHEDYDAQGLYLYEVQCGCTAWGESLLEVARRIIPLDARPRIDRRLARAGLIRRRINLPQFERIGYPEAIYLQLHHAQRALTFETPSEFALERRAAAHVAFIDECVRRIAAGERA